MPQVSVIIPVFNSARFIGRALQSVFEQTFRDFEVIVVDDGSEDHDELSTVLSEWVDKIDYIRQPNGGPARARNTGIARASGELVAFLDADDDWLPEKLACQVDYFAKYADTGLLHTAIVGDAQPGALPGPPRQAFCELFHTVFFINTLTVMVPRRVLDAVGVFDERREVHIEDWDLWLRIAASYPIGYLDEPLAFHRPGGSMSSQVDRTYSAQAFVIEKNKELCARACLTHRLSPRRCERSRRHVLHRDWGYDLLAGGDWKGAREQFSRALTHSPWEPRTAALYLSTFVSTRRREQIGRVMPHTPRGSTSGSPAPSTSRASKISLVHDTTYRRLRRRTTARLHDLDDAIYRFSRSRRRVLFDAASPVSVAVFKPVYERLRSDPRLEFWFTVTGRVWQSDEIFSPAGITDNIVSAATAARMKVDVYVNTDLWDMTWLGRRTRRVHMFHGVAGKYGLDTPFDLAVTISTFDSLMFANRDRRTRYIQADLVPDDDLKAALIGYPKVDCLVDGTLDRPRIVRELGLDLNVPVVLYAPTWSPYSSLNGMGEEIIERLAAQGLQVIVKLHDRSYDRRDRGAGGVDWALVLSKYDSHPLVRIVREADSSPFLAAADLLISDHSSIAFEYTLLDRPIVVIDRQELIQQAGVNPEKVRLLRSAAHVVNGTPELTPAVIRALRSPADLSIERQRIGERLFYKPGTAADRAVALMYRLLDLPVRADTRELVETPRALSALG
jgi:glycosyltransferase involved in cell wall biosynthesis